MRSEISTTTLANRALITPEKYDCTRQGYWLDTVCGRSFSLNLRLYGADGAAIDTRWKSGDFEKVG